MFENFMRINRRTRHFDKGVHCFHEFLSAVRLEAVGHGVCEEQAEHWGQHADSPLLHLNAARVFVEILELEPRLEVLAVATTIRKNRS